MTLPLQTFQQIVAADATAAQRIVPQGLFCRGNADNNWYAIEVDPATGLLPVNASVSFSNDTNYGVVGANTIRTAAQIGNATGAADFNSGTSGLQTLRVTIATDDVVDIRALNSGVDSVSVIQGSLWEIENITGTISLPTGASTDALQTAGNASLSSIDSKLNTLGQKAMAASVPVVIASDQSAVPVTLGGTALDFGASAAALRVAALLGNATGFADFNSGAAGAQTLRTVISTRSEAAATPLATRLSDGSAFYNAPTTAQIPATLGQKAMAASLAVVVASDQSAIPVTPPALTPVVTQDFGSIAFGSLSTSFATILTTAADANIVAIFSSLDTPVTVSLDGGVTSFLNLDSESIVLDLATSRMVLSSGAVIQAKYSGSAPTTGSIRVSVLG